MTSSYFALLLTTIISYVCSKNVTDYNHFSGGQGRGRCPLHDNVETRHDLEVKKAAAEAIKKAKAENPDMSSTDLMVQVSDRVKRAEEARRDPAQVQHNAFPVHFAGGAFVHAPVPPPPPPLIARAHPAIQPLPQYVPVPPFEQAPLYDFFPQPQPVLGGEGFIFDPMHALDIQAPQEPYVLLSSIVHPSVNSLNHANNDQ
jgi:hypothetical protein